MIGSAREDRYTRAQAHESWLLYAVQVSRKEARPGVARIVGGVVVRPDINLVYTALEAEWTIQGAAVSQKEPPIRRPTRRRCPVRGALGRGRGGSGEPADQQPNHYSRRQAPEPANLH